jgi:hypothetical protein
MSFRASVADLFTLRKAPPQWPLALQAGAAMTLPILGFTLAGRQDLGLMASLGAFLVLHLPDRSRRERALELPVIMAGFLVSAFAGIATSTSLVGNLAAMLVIALLSSFLGLGLDVGSPGSMFYVLITGAVGALVAPVSQGGSGVSPALVVGMLSVGMATAYLLVLSPLLLPGGRRRDAVRYAARRPWRFVVDAEFRRVFIRLSIATVLGVAVGGLLGLHRVHWVLLAIIAILQKDSQVRLSMLRALHRVLGTAVALVVFYGIALWNPQGVVLALLIGVLMAMFEILVPRNLSLSLVAITPMALVIAAKSGQAPLLDVVDVRVVDTAAGALVAITVLVAVSLGRMIVTKTTVRSPVWSGRSRPEGRA